MPEKKNILICPLNWGLGHASRCIPLIKILNQAGHHVVIAADGPAARLLKNVFPDNESVIFGDYNIRYSKGGHLVRTILWQIPKILFRIAAEHHKVKSIVKKYNIDTLISDNRFGLWNRKIRTVYVTHQLFIKSPAGNRLVEKWLQKIHFFFIKKYDVCWIPDLTGDFKLSGELSGKHPLPANARFIGLLSDFCDAPLQTTTGYDVCAVISGPEPQRSIFQRLLLEQLKNSGKKAVVILGKPAEKSISTTDKNITVFNYLTADEIKKYFMCSEYVIARAGYSTIMDLAVTGRKAILVPTPGQTEQEYLAGYLKQKKIYYSTKQEGFDVNTALKKAANYSGISHCCDMQKLEEIILNTIS
ncbi:MAG TPA: glycosyltransferase [Bacteroidales bacterium]|nr:hypothetical protein [Bacteroidales bacterium]HNZ43284.1 glycosyltransferase [Bacteroidales bacterium]HOH83891.1 glycosyltransferase [Bacteroidales bacterium]HPB25152.1 glycosyltransferase [Bacteroidales bacterium]HPI31103.1 glycosyltransferase [Bacteroidales bacterium]